jgi:RimJ/RimL family protein N-acetyltransferase
MCQLLSIQPVHRNAELRIRLGEPDRCGRGLGTEAVRLLVAFAFADLNLERVYLYVQERNQRAIRCYEKAGFRSEGLLRRHAFVDGAYQNIVVMGVNREDMGA